MRTSVVSAMASVCVVAMLAVWCGSESGAAQPTERPPNVVIIFLDDSGWSDFHPFGSPPYETPNVVKLAEQGRRFDNFYVPQAICSASRSALMTGCYPGRTRMFGAHPPKARGLDPKFATLGNVLQSAGYRTAIFGKWHLGDQPDTRPPTRGFHESSGLMYSNDMWKFHPENPEFWGKYPLPYWKNGKVTIESVTEQHQTMLTTWYTEDAVDFIQRNKKGPFFLYVPHSMPHVPIFCSDKFLGKSGAGLYGDVMMEIDWSIGKILGALRDNGVEENTLVVFTSDNGPWISYGNHAGATPFREAKATGFDGGLRSACIIKYPGQVEAGTKCSETICSIDIMPTVARLAGAELPANPIDGHDVWGIVTGQPRAQNRHDYYPFSTGRTFEGVISGDGRWKLHLPHRYRTLVRPGNDGQPGEYENREIELSLFDMQKDPQEMTSVVAEYPDVAAKLGEFAKQHQQRFYADTP
jgi:arylsulfatase A-like enzyme